MKIEDDGVENIILFKCVGTDPEENKKVNCDGDVVSLIDAIKICLKIMLLHWLDLEQMKNKVIIGL